MYGVQQQTQLINSINWPSQIFFLQNKTIFFCYDNNEKIFWDKNYYVVV